MLKNRRSPNICCDFTTQVAKYNANLVESLTIKQANNTSCATYRIVLSAMGLYLQNADDARSFAIISSSIVKLDTI